MEGGSYMERTIRTDHGIWRVLTMVSDLLILNLLTLVFCIPVITAGAALTAMSHVLLLMARGEEGYVRKSFMKYFRQNLKRSTIIWTGYLAAGALLTYAYRMSGGAGHPAGYIVFAAGLLTAAAFLYQIPFTARFDNTPAETLRYGIILAFAHPVRTAVMLLIVLFAATVYRNFIEWILPLVLMFGLTLPGYLCLKLISPVFLTLEK